MKKILVPCDFSEPSIQAFRFALEIAAKSKGEVILLNAMEQPVLYDTTLMPALYFEEAFFKEMKANAEKNLKKLKSKWVKDRTKVTAYTDYGSIMDCVARLTKEVKADLIVMGTRGATGLRDYFVGSNTEKMVRRATVPVIAVKKYVKASAIRHIVFPNTLGTDQEDLTLRVKDLQELFNAKIHILYVNTPGNFRADTDSKKQLSEFAKRFMFKDFTLNVFNDIDQEEGVIHFANHIGANMVAMATHGRRGISRLMNGSIAEDVVNHFDLPIWTCVEK